MSLVEKALKKMQEAAQPASPSKPVRVEPRPFGKVVERPTPAPAHGQVHPSGRIVTINHAALRATELLPPEHQERQIAQQYRQIKRPLIANAIGRDGPRLDKGQLIMLSSAMSGDGKTFNAINLSLSMAREKDLRVVLVDADLPKPHLSRLFGVATEPGLVDAIVDANVDPETLIFPTDIPSLSFLAAGQRAENTTELLSSERMQQVAAILAKNDPHRIVIFDSSPLLMATESQALSHVVGQVVVVARARVTSHEMLLDALSHLADHPAVSLVLNQSAEPSTSGYYYHGYGDTEPARNA